MKTRFIKRLFCLLICFLLVIGLLPISAFAIVSPDKSVEILMEDGDESTGYSFKQQVAIQFLLEKGLLITIDDIQGVKNNADKLLFTINENIINLQDNLTKRDNIHYTLTLQERTDLEVDTGESIAEIHLIFVPEEDLVDGVIIIEVKTGDDIMGYTKNQKLGLYILVFAQRLVWNESLDGYTNVNGKLLIARDNDNSVVLPNDVTAQDNIKYMLPPEEIAEIKSEFGLDVSEINLNFIVDAVEYIVSYDSNGGSGTMIGDIVAAGNMFTLEACDYLAPNGYKFKAWAIGSPSGIQKQPGDKITITGETYIYAVWEELIKIDTITAVVAGAFEHLTVGSTNVATNGKNYKVSIINWYDCDNVFNYGSSNVLQPTDVFESGKTYTVGIRFEPDDGYALVNNLDVKINGQDGKIGGWESGGRNFFITITIPYVKTFPDVNKNGWYFEAVSYAVSTGILKGYENGKFGTSDGIQRQDFLAMLARFDGADLSLYEDMHGEFKDVGRNAYYESSVNWGKANNIVSGYNDGRFGVGDKITREQIVTFLWRYAQYKGIDVSVSNASKQAIKNQYKDFGKVSSFSQDAVLWALDRGVIGGKDPQTIAPQGNAQRCEVAQIMYNIFKKSIFD